MDPKIYKPGAYNTPGIYKGSGSIYKGRGVYNIGKDYPKYINGPIIDDVQYTAVQINNLGWSLPIKYITSNYFYPNNDPQNQDLGLLYQLKIGYNEINPLLNDGWRFPTRSDVENLISSVDDSKKLISTNFGGNDFFGFNCEFEGCRDSSGNFVKFGDASFFWTTSIFEDWPHASYCGKIDINGVYVNDGSGTINELYNTACFIRLCKDL